MADRLDEGPREGDVCSLRGLDFQKFIEEQLGKLMSLSAVYDLLHELIPRTGQFGGKPSSAGTR